VLFLANARTEFILQKALLEQWKQDRGHEYLMGLVPMQKANQSIQSLNKIVGFLRATFTTTSISHFILLNGAVPTLQSLDPLMSSNMT